MRSLPSSDTQMRSSRTCLSGLGWSHLTSGRCYKRPFYLLMVEQNSAVYLRHFFFIRLPTDGHLDGSMLSLLLKRGTRMSCDILIWFPLDIDTVAGLLDYVAIVLFTFGGRDFTLFSIKAVPIYLPPVVCHGLFLLPLLYRFFRLSDQKQTII